MEFQYALLKMDESEYWFNYNEDYANAELVDLRYNFVTNFQLNQGDEEVIVTVTAIISSNDNKTVFVRNSVRAVYGIKPYSEVVADGDGQFKVTAPCLIETFVNIAIGALRGFLVKNLKGTPLDKQVLPLIPMPEIKKMLSIN